MLALPPVVFLLKISASGTGILPMPEAPYRS